MKNGLLVRKRFLPLPLLVSLLLSLSGCGGGGAEVRTESYTTTLGQELKELDDAYKQGIISEKDYEKSKERLIKKRTK